MMEEMLFERVMTQDQVGLLGDLLSGSERIVLTAHHGPDGDALGSLGALMIVLSALGKQVNAIIPNAFPENLGFSPMVDKFLRYTDQREACDQALAHADLVFSLDYNALHRVGPAMQQVMENCQAPRVMIDHHLNPQLEAYVLAISQPQMCSTCEVVLHVIHEMGWLPLLGCDAASALYLGLLTDTGAFSYACTRSEVFRCVALLLDRGVDKDRIFRRVFWGQSEQRMRMMGYLLYVNLQTLPLQHTAFITLSNEEYRRFRLKNGDTEGIVNLPLELEGIRLSIFLREDTEVVGKVRVSMRSVDEVPCNEITQAFFNGGGHKNAAGGSFMGTLEDALLRARSAVEHFADRIAPPQK